MSADFADIFELHAVPDEKLALPTVTPPPGWHYALTYHHGQFACRTLARWSRKGRQVGNAMEFDLLVGPGASWRCRLRLEMVRGEALPALRPAATIRQVADSGRPFRTACRRTRVLDQALPALAGPVYQRALTDLDRLMLRLPTGETIVGAGLPYFMTLFGRDSLITAYQTLSIYPPLAADVLRALARFQGTVDDPTTDQEPDKIPHEVREGELATGDRRYGCYYGSIDATPLFLFVFGTYLQQTGDQGLADELWPAAEAALAWIDHYGDRDGDGFVEYERRTPNGLQNQGWKDSWDAICFADGRLAQGPIALCEVQGYVYRAKALMAELYDQRGQRERAMALHQEARLLQERFEAAYWLPGEGTYALALDGAKRQVDAVASNAAHCLWSGIASAEHAASVVERLRQEDMFSGWGLRTLSTRMARYNPISYHNGSIWPHDTMLAAAGFLRYGHGAAARQLLNAVLEAGVQFPDQRLPELFSGRRRQQACQPVSYPDANIPQAWAAGSVVLAAELLRQLGNKRSRPEDAYLRHAILTPGR